MIIIISIFGLFTKKNNKNINNKQEREQVERKFSYMHSAIIRIAKIIIQEHGKKPPERRKQKINELKNLGFIDEKLHRQINEALGFRDILDHSYDAVIDDEKVYYIYQNELERYKKYVKQVEKNIE